MTNKQVAFVNEYLIDMNASAASLRAGYSSDQYGRELMTKPHIREAIDAALVERARGVMATAEGVINGLWEIATSGESESARVRAFELVGKHLGVTFTDTVRHEGEERIKITLGPSD